MNSLNFTGNCGRDAEVRYLASGDAVVTFSVALSSGYGEKKITTWLNCSMFGKRGESVSEYIKKGTQVAISGEFTARPYQSKDGAEKLSLDVRVNDLTLIGGKAQPQEDRPERNQDNPTYGKDTTSQSQDLDDFEKVPF